MLILLHHKLYMLHLICYTTHCYIDSQRLSFATNAEEGVYRFAYNETYITSEGVVVSGPLPLGEFNITCLLDGQPSSTITYLNQGGDGGTFQVDPNTGALSLQAERELDFETTRNYHFNVTCSVPSVVGDGVAQVNFDVIPVNEFEPMLNPTRLFVLPREDAPIGSILVSTLPNVGALRTFSATDMDAGPDGELRYTLGFNDNLTSFDIDDRTGTLSISQSLDVDNTVSGFLTEEVRLTVCDVVPPVPSCPNVLLNVIISSANDNDPVFSQDMYQVTVPENIPLGSIIVDVSCTDADVGEGSFKNVTSSSSLFNVTDFPDGQTIALTGELDFETARSHRVTLTCFDMDDTSTDASFIVTVEPVNDNQPRFSTSEYSFAMNRVETIGTEIGRVEASDGDEVTGGELTYTLTGNDNFQIQDNGTIIVTDIIEEQALIFVMKVTVSDGEFSDTASVMIRVGPLTVPEIIVVSMGAVIFLVLVIAFCGYGFFCCSRL